MKKYVSYFTAAMLLTVSGSAIAADLANKKAPPAPPATPMWKGFYVGLNAGGIWSNSGSADMTTYPLYTPLTNSLTNTDITSFYTSLTGPLRFGSTNGFIGGGQLGYNWQPGYLNNSLVFGFESDIQGVISTGKSTRSFSNIASVGSAGSVLNNISANGNMDFFGTVRGRIGYLAMPNFLLYGTGGIAYGNVSYSVNLTQYGFNTNGAFNQLALGSGNYSNVQVGWTAGGGAEWMFLPNWSAKVEYLYYDLGANNLNINTAAGRVSTLTATVPGVGGYWTSSTITNNATGNLVRAGVNYHLSLSPSAIAAKY